MFVLCLLYKDGNMERERQKDLKVQNGSKEKKNPRFLHVVFLDVRAVGQIFLQYFGGFMSVSHRFP